MTICVFCQQECEPAPSSRGWTAITPTTGLHFDCARKVARQGDVIDELEANEKLDKIPPIDLSEQQKNILVKETIETLAKPLIYTYMLCGCKKYITGTVKNEATGELFSLSFKKIELKPIPQDELFKTIGNILQANIHYAPQMNGFVVHGAIEQIKELIFSRQISFGIWYSGMKEEKVIRAHQMYLREKEGI